MPYVVSQTFMTIGDPGEVTCATLEEAEKEAARQRSELASYVAQLETPFDGPRTVASTANFEERTWNGAHRLAGGCRRYGLAAGEHVAECAVEIREIEEAI